MEQFSSEIGKQKRAAARRERSSTQVRVQSTNANLGHPPMDSRHYAKVRKGECKSRRLAEHTPVNRRQCLLYSSLQFQRELVLLWRIAMRKVSFYGVALLAFVGFSRTNSMATQTVFLDYGSVTTCRAIFGGVMTIDGEWFNNVVGSVRPPVDQEYPIMGVSWHCVNNYSGSVYYNTTLCKCFKTVRAADSATVNNPPPPYTFSSDPYPQSSSGFGCLGG